MHRQAKALVDAVSGMITRHVLDGTRSQDAGAIERSEVEQHLIEGHQIGGGAVSSPPGTPARQKAGVFRSASVSCSPLSVR